MGTLSTIKDKIIEKMEELEADVDTYIKEVYAYPNLTPTKFPAISLGYPNDPEVSEQRTNMSNRRVVEYPIFLICPQPKNANDYTSLLNSIDQVRDKFRVKNTRNTLDGAVSINQGITRVEVDDINSNQDFVVYACTLTLEVLESLS